jgi:hypothetical protein
MGVGGYTYPVHLSVFFNKHGGLSQIHLSLNQSQIALNELFQIKYSTQQLHQDKKI